MRRRVLACPSLKRRISGDIAGPIVAADIVSLGLISLHGRFLLVFRRTPGEEPLAEPGDNRADKLAIAFKPSASPKEAGRCRASARRAGRRA